MPNRNLQDKIKSALKEAGISYDFYSGILYGKFRVSSEESLSDSQALVLIGYLERLSRYRRLHGAD